MHRFFAGGLMVGLLAPLAAFADEDPKALALKARTVFKQHCHRCHHGEGSAGGSFDVLVDKSLSLASDDGMPYVVPSKPDDSLIFQRMAKGEMPPKEIRDRPGKAEIEIIRQWIAGGAPPYPSIKGRAFVSTRDILMALREDLGRADPEDRPFLRYFTLAHLHNNPKVPDEDLNIYRAALSKAVNSLSWKPRIVLPRPVDKAQTVLAVDIRDLDWDRNSLWNEVMRAYPYGLRFQAHPDEALQGLDGDVVKITACELPLVRADWFVATATRPPLYHALLQLPKTAAELESKLDVNVVDNFRRDRLARGGFFPSGISGQNRMVERHEARYGAYWKSYDFKKDGERIDLKRFPLGPEFEGNEFTDQAFKHAGGEIIFHLPNGLQGYLLIDGDDNRIDVGPIDVVGDSLKTSGTNEIVTGVSCMACHKQGLISFKDQIRGGAAVFGAAKRKVQRLYVEAEKMQQLIKEDAEKFALSAKRATAPFLCVGENKSKPVEEFPEPIGEIARLYTLAPLDLPAVACELGLEKPEQMIADLGKKRVQQLGLAPLTTGGKLDRRLWETGKGMSLMQRVAREFGATPFDFGP
jgi:mono/diheme cytochrome c family protein